MTVDDRTRQQLHERLTNVLGEQEANTLMAYLPTELSPETTSLTPATRLRSLSADRNPRHELHSEFVPLRTEITTLRHHVTAEDTNLRSEMTIGLIRERDEVHRASWTMLMALASMTAVAAWLFALLS